MFSFFVYSIDNLAVIWYYLHITCNVPKKGTGRKRMKKTLRRILACAVVFATVFWLSQTEALAYPYKNHDIYETESTLGQYFGPDFHSESFVMPEDGQVKLNASLINTKIIPGKLTITIQKGREEGSEKIKEIAEITESTPLKDFVVDLEAGKYYLGYKLTNDIGNIFDDTMISFNCTLEVILSEPDNISELKVNTVNSFEEITRKGYEELKFRDGETISDIIIPFTVKKGDGIYISLGNEYSLCYITGRIYKDKACTVAVGKSFDLGLRHKYGDFERALTGEGTYYIKFSFYNDGNNTLAEVPFFVKLYELNGSDRTITNGKTTLSYQDKASKKINYKITVKSKSVLKFKVVPYDSSEGWNVTFSLLDKNKKVISKGSKIYSDRDDGGEYDNLGKVYTVPAGTYYVEISASSKLYELSYAYDKAVKNAGTTKAKAKNLKIMQTQANGAITFADKVSSVDWFKFTVTSQQYVQLYIDCLLDGKFDFEILDSKGNVLYKFSKKNEVDKVFISGWCGGTFDKGTYYIKVYKKGKSSNVSYRFALYDYQ